MLENMRNVGYKKLMVVRHEYKMTEEMGEGNFHTDRRGR
jgi:hypothetical protein